MEPNAMLTADAQASHRPNASASLSLVLQASDVTPTTRRRTALSCPRMKIEAGLFVSRYRERVRRDDVQSSQGQDQQLAAVGRHQHPAVDCDRPVELRV